MKTILIDTDELKTPKQIQDLINKQKPKKGDEVKLKTGLADDSLGFLAIIIILAIALLFQNKEKKEFVDGIQADLFGKYSSAKEVEEDIAKQYGIRVTKEQKENKEHEEWSRFSMQNLASAYGENEPDYSNVKIKEPNPNYKSWKKDK